MREAGRDRDDELRGVIDPVVLVGGLAVLAALAVALLQAGVSLHAAQRVTAGALLLGAAAALVRSPQNGLLLLFLVPAVTNGEHPRPYFFLLELLVYLTLLAGFASHWWRRRRLRVPHAGWLALFLVSTLVSFPLDVKELWLELSITSWPEILDALRRADLWSSVFYVRTVLDVASGIALYVLVVNARWPPELLVRLATGATLLYAAVTILGLTSLAGFTAGLFLTLHFRPGPGGGFAGVGFNTSYFAQYALAYFPLVVLVLAERTPRWARGLAAAAALASGYTVFRTNQRGAYLVLGVAVVLLLLVVFADRKRAPDRPRLAVPAALAGVAFAVVLLVVAPTGTTMSGRFTDLWRSGDPYRQHVLGMAWRMFLDEPLLGIGAGRYAHAFQTYSTRLVEFNWGSLSSHNLYAQLLAEQGSLGLLSFLALLGAALAPAVRQPREPGALRTVVLFLLVSLGSWLVYGLLQYTFLLRSMQVYFWIALGLVVALTGERARPTRITRAVLVGLFLLTVAAAGSRAYVAAARPVPPGTAVGVFAWQTGDVRWTKERAHLVMAVEGRVLRVWLAFPIVQVVGRPQTVEIALDGRLIRRVTLDTADWRLVEVPVPGPRGRTAHVGIRPEFTVVPAALGLNPDTRRLGVLMRPVAWADP